MFYLILIPKKAFESYLNVSLKNKDVIKEPIDIRKREKINITMPKDKIIALDVFAKKHKTNRSRILTTLTQMLFDNRVNYPKL